MIYAREDAKPVIPGVRTGVLRRCGKQPFDGKAAAQEGEPRRV